MSIFIATGSNLGDRKKFLQETKRILNQHFQFVAESRIYESPAVDYRAQPDFYNQVLEYETPEKNPVECMKLLLEIEKQMGRNRTTPKGPRTIDIDLIFWNDLHVNTPELTLPHPRAFERSFVILPLSELPGFAHLKTKFDFKFEFDNSAHPVFFV